MNKTLSVCFVCHGNICRSPLAQGVMESIVNQEGLEKSILISSAGVSSWHVGEPPDSRMQDTASNHGISLNSRGLHFQGHDFNQIDLVNLYDLMRKLVTNYFYFALLILIIKGNWKFQILTMEVEKVSNLSIKWSIEPVLKFLNI
jgi:hypothetical protein